MEKGEIQSKIGLLKKQLADSQGLRNEEARLSEFREKLESEITVLEHDIQESHYKHEEIESKKRLTSECQAKMLEIDHILDELEEWTEEKVVAITVELISLILQLHPEQQLAYNDLFSRLNDANHMEIHYKTIESHLNQIIAALNTMITKRGEVKKRGVLSYIWGPNPNVIIGRSLKEVCDTAEACLTCEPQSEVIRDELKELMGHCKGRWGFRTIDKVFIPAKQSLTGHREDIGQKRDQLKTEIQDLETQMRAWIEQYSVFQ